jgi:hypothetical protein
MAEAAIMFTVTPVVYTRVWYGGDWRFPLKLLLKFKLLPLIILLYTTSYLEGLKQKLNAWHHIII